MQLLMLENSSCKYALQRVIIISYSKHLRDFYLPSIYQNCNARMLAKHAYENKHVKRAAMDLSKLTLEHDTKRLHTLQQRMFSSN
jgi:hypothetical protein